MEIRKLMQFNTNYILGPYKHVMFSQILWILIFLGSFKYILFNNQKKL